MQPTDDTCGQTTVAMIAGVSVDEVIRITGVIRGTFDEEMQYALDVLGFQCGKPRTVPYEDHRTSRFHFPACCVGTVQWHGLNDEMYHAILINKGIVYDPAFGGVVPIHGYVTNILPRDHRHLAEIFAIKGRKNGPPKEHV
jgi:hypothetical protein